MSPETIRRHAPRRLAQGNGPGYLQFWKDDSGLEFDTAAETIHAFLTCALDDDDAVILFASDGDFLARRTNRGIIKFGGGIWSE